MKMSAGAPFSIWRASAELAAYDTSTLPPLPSQNAAQARPLPPSGLPQRKRSLGVPARARTVVQRQRSRQDTPPSHECPPFVIYMEYNDWHPITQLVMIADTKQYEKSGRLRRRLSR